jgi:hypothetical protein
MSRILIIGLISIVLVAESSLASAQDRDHRAPPGMQGPPPGHGYGQQYGRWDGPPPHGWTRQRWQSRQIYLRRHPDRRDDHSDAIITGMLGFALGAAIAGSQNDQTYARSRMGDRDWVNYCSRRYRSFDRRSGTYLAYDGLRYYCRMP